MMHKRYLTWAAVMSAVIIASTSISVTAAEILGGFMANESDYRIDLITPVLGASEFNETYDMAFTVSTSSSAVTVSESDYRFEGNIYSAGVGGAYIESDYNLYLVPEQSFFSQKTNVTAYDPTTQEDGTSCPTAYSMPKYEQSYSGFRHYKFTLNETCDVVISMTPTSDYDLHVLWNGSCPTISSYDCRPYSSGGTTETCSRSGLASGTYFSLVNRYSGSGYFNLTVSTSNCLETTTTSTTTTTTSSTTTSTTTTTTLPEDGASCNTAYTLPKNDQDYSGYKYYKFTLNQICDVNVSMKVSPASDYDLHVLWTGNCPTFSSYDCRPYSGAGASEYCDTLGLNPGTYFSMVNKYGGSGGFNISVSTSNCVTTTTSTTTTTTTSTTTTTTTTTSTTSTSTTTISDLSPLNVVLSLPPNNSADADGNVSLVYNASDDKATKLSCILYHNASGWKANETHEIKPPAQDSFNLNLSDGKYLWNVLCNDTVHTSFAQSSWSFTVNTTVADLTPPNVTLISPPNGSSDVDGWVEFNYSVWDNMAYTLTCSLYSNASGWATVETRVGVANSTQDSFNENLANGMYLWNVLCSDGSNTASHTSNWTVTVAVTTTTTTTTTSTTSTTLTKPEQTTTSTTTTSTSTTSTTTLTKNIVINEFLPHPSGSSQEWIELYNKENYSVNLGGWVLDDASSGGSEPYIISNGTSIHAKNFAVFYRADTGIVLGDVGDSILLLTGSNTVVDNYTYYYSQRGISIGRETDGSSEWTTFELPTPGMSNAGVNDTKPPQITLDSPPDGSADADGNVFLKYTPQDMSLISDCMLYTNVTGVWQETQIDSTILVNSQNSFSLIGLSNGRYLWNVQCTDVTSKSSFAPQSMTFRVNKTVDQTFTQPLNLTLNSTTNLTSAETNVSVEINVTENITNAYISISSSSNNTKNASLSVPGLNRFITIEANTELEESVSHLLLVIRYTDAEVAAAGLDESSLGIYWFNESSGIWRLLDSGAMGWVYATGVNATENFVWADVAHFSDYAIAQSTQITEIPLVVGWNLISLPVM